MPPDRKSRSGTVVTNAERAATGQVRLPTIWLEPDVADLLEAYRLETGCTAKEAISEGIRRLVGRGSARRR